jgi:DegV family protein with EDD domain
MPQIAIVTDSAANLPPALAERYGVQVVPLNLHWNGQAYRDGVDMSAGELYRQLRANPDNLPSSSSPSVGDFLRTYTRLSQEAEAIVSIHIATELSATSVAAKHARSLVEGPTIEVLDSRTATMGCGFVVLGAARAAVQGAGLQMVVETARAIIRRVHVYGVLDSLRYVQRSGRVPAIAAIAGSLLDIHPLLFIKDGRAGLLEIQRTKRRAVRRLLDVVKEKAAGHRIHAAVMHADAAEDAARLRHDLAQRCECHELYTSEFTPVMGAYAGPGLLAVAFYAELE